MTKGMYWSDFVMQADQISHAMVMTEPQKMRELRPRCCERGAQTRGPTTEPAMAAVTWRTSTSLEHMITSSRRTHRIRYFDRRDMVKNSLGHEASLVRKLLSQADARGE